MPRRGIDLFTFDQQRIRHPAPVEQLKPLHRIASETMLVAVKMRGYLANSPRELTVPVEANQR